jgi:hypothetical protein
MQIQQTYDRMKIAHGSDAVARTKTAMIHNIRDLRTNSKGEVVHYKHHWESKLAQGSYQAEAKKFKDVKVGQAFRFSSEKKFPYSGMARGPWIKTSHSHYRHADEDHHRERYGDKDLKVGSHHAEVE